MTNWRIHKAVNNGILGIAALSLFGLSLGIIPELDKTVFFAPWRMILGAGALWVMYSYNQMIRG